MHNTTKKEVRSVYQRMAAKVPPPSTPGVHIRRTCFPDGTTLNYGGAQ